MEVGELFTRRQAVMSGTSDNDLGQLVRTGQITRVARGVYRLGSAALPDPAGLAASLKASISRASAVAWYGASLVEPPNSLQLTVPRSRGRRSDEIPGVTIHRADVPAAEL